jgi:hypothetical protein
LIGPGLVVTKAPVAGSKRISTLEAGEEVADGEEECKRAWTLVHLFLTCLPTLGVRIGLKIPSSPSSLLTSLLLQPALDAFHVDEEHDPEIDPLLQKHTPKPRGL